MDILYGFIYNYCVALYVSSYIIMFGTCVSMDLYVLICVDTLATLVTLSIIVMKDCVLRMYV